MVCKRSVKEDVVNDGKVTWVFIDYTNSFQTMGADQLVDNGKIGHKRKVTQATAIVPSFFC